MGKLLKLFFRLIAGLFTLLLLAIVIIPIVVDPNDYKETIVQEVEKATGRQLQIDGDINLSLFPWVGIELSKIELSNAAGFSDKPFARLNSLALRVKLMPLLSQQVEVDTIGLDGLQLNLEKDAEGKTNWQDLAASDKANNSPATPSESTSSDSSKIEKISIGGIDISNAQVSWHDQSKGQTITLEKVNLNTGHIQQGKPVDIEMSLILNNNQPQITLAVSITTTLLLDQSKGLLSMDQLALVVDASGQAVQGKKIQTSLKATVALALDGSYAKVENISIDSGDVSLQGNVNATELSSAKPKVKGNIILTEFNLKRWLETHEFPLPDMSDADVLSRFGANFNLMIEGSHTQISDLQLVLDDSVTSGSVSLNEGALGFDLNVNKINLDRYLPKAVDTTTQASSDEKMNQTTSELIPVETLRSLNLNGQIKIGELLVNKIIMQDVLLQVKAKKGVLKVQQKIGEFYQGSVNSTVNIDVSGKTPVLKVNADVNKVQAGDLLMVIAGQDKISGLANFSSNLRVKGNSMEAFKQSLNGTMKFRFDNGAVKGFNLAQMIRNAKAKLTRKSVSNDASNQTDFSEMSGSAIITNGILENKDLLAKSPFIRVNGSGKVNLVNESLDYLVKTVIVGTSKGQGGGDLKDLSGLTIPVKITGSFDNPKPRIDLGSLLKSQAKEKLKAKVKEKLKEKLKGSLGDKLKGSLGDQLKSGLGDKLKGLF